MKNPEEERDKKTENLFEEIMTGNLSRFDGKH